TQDGPAADLKLVRKLSREYDRAIRAEEDAPTIDKAYRLAAASERALRRLQAAQAGLPLPEPTLPRTALNLAKQGLAALANIGRAIARAVRTKAALLKAQAAAKITRAARALSDTTTKEIEMKKPKQLKVTAFFRPFNRVRERMNVYVVEFVAKVGTAVEDLIEMAHDAGASRGARTPAGVFELQTDEGIWSTPTGSKLLTTSNSGLSPRATFATWEQLEAAEAAS
ncbi:MAG TPA: hypothetical protein VES97_04325, partial [Solirubrobacteraceae bacterium]|nr:hypothetical protein [Solirubrobacteraceae bacterium]